MISYKNDVDSFVIVSSDSDYWGLISSLPDAHFLVMIEREKCGPDMKEALADSGIFYCYLDDFYSGNLRTLQKIKHNYSWVIGVSKSFNPESCLDHTGKPNSNYIADLPVFQRFIIKPFYECLV